MWKDNSGGALLAGGRWGNGEVFQRELSSGVNLPLSPEGWAGVSWQMLSGREEGSG